MIHGRGERVTYSLAAGVRAADVQHILTGPDHLLFVAGLLLIMTGSWYAAGPAWAGGPTSVMIVSPTTGQAAALHTSNARYQQLVEAVDAYDSPTGPTTPPSTVVTE